MNKIKVIQCRFCQAGHPRTSEFFYFNKKTGHVLICKKLNSFNWLKRQKKIRMRLGQTLRSRVREAIKGRGWKNREKLTKHLGCSIPELQNHIRNQFQPGMTWENHGKWHIDHKIPLAKAKTPSQLYELCHYSNLQPLWAIDNLKKGSKI